MTKKREIEVWVEEERKEVKKRKKAYEEERVRALKMTDEVEADQKHIIGILRSTQEPNSMVPGMKSEDFRQPSSHSYRSNKNGGTASSRHDPSSYRIMDMINETRNEEYCLRTNSDEIDSSG